MNTETPSTDISTTDQNKPASGTGTVAARVVLSVLIIAAGIIVAKYLVSSAPKAPKKPPAKIVPLVKVENLYPTSEDIIIQTMGTVIPAKALTLRSRVSGEIIYKHPEFIEGGLLKKETGILQIDDTDYKLALARKQSTVVNARYALSLEQGHQAVAKREWELLNAGTDTSEDAALALRKPHLEKVLADLAAAEAELDQAILNHRRTNIFSPFNAIIGKAYVEVGSQITTQDSLAELIATDEYWIQVSIPVDRLQWITIPGNYKENGASAQISYRNGHRLTGTVIKLLSDLETEGRMARLLVSVKDPLGLKTTTGNGQPPLLIGEYVHVSISGNTVDAVYKIPRTALRDNKYIWIAGQNMKLQIRSVKPFWRDRDFVLIRDGLTPGERIIISELATPIADMLLNIEDIKETSE